MQKGWEGFITFFGTKDLQKTDEFYRNLLGLSLYKDQGVCRIYDVANGGKIGFCSHIKVVREEKSPIITLLTDDVDTIYNKFKQHGYKMEDSPKVHTKFHIYHFFIKDPNGYTVEIQRFLDT